MARLTAAETNLAEGRNIVLDGDTLRIGALVTHRQVEVSPLVRERAPLLATAYGRIGTVRIRNVERPVRRHRFAGGCRATSA